MIYFDYAATTPMDDEAVELYANIAKHNYGNSSSLHDIGSRADQILSYCREELAEILNVHKKGIYFTSGGTESNLLSIISLAKTKFYNGKHIITSMAEHASVHSAMEYLKKDGFEVTYLPFTTDGIVDLDTLKRAIRKDTILVSIQHVNSEIGTIQPIRDISDCLRERDILFHSDCVQSFGKTELKEITPYLDGLSLSSHKIYGPKGVGAVYINPIHHINPVFPGFHHENSFRGGTVNVPGIAAFVYAAKKIHEQNRQNIYSQFREIFMNKLNHFQEHFEIYQSTNNKMQLPQIIGMRVNGLEGQWTMLESNRNGYAISTGSACQVGHQEPSAAMKALGIRTGKANEFIRITFGKDTEEHHVKEFADFLIQLSLQRGNEKDLIK
ncbi:cysteine desulfurase [Heyndrickxia shackletonii]|uniref:Cysteine desulfurase n=1 Tax=Heyndrickxia shackletonii TaxID=157838 RepID=A0A0Q3TIF8_9BACI|nr:IscS subfamily cysteine desulfurase [Heyndrickxia shackletonii]KQL53417.1 cysteine desulfurase [Heyndrickxia shackletonii]NEY99987.1 aminotransferase class V-fold PLP-dependent enzyme [Heyndrickxia shackletonii]